MSGVIRVAEVDEVDGTLRPETPPVLRLPAEGRARVGLAMVAV
jgi:hypothetical protein